MGLCHGLDVLAQPSRLCFWFLLASILRTALACTKCGKPTCACAKCGRSEAVHVGKDGKSRNDRFQDPALDEMFEPVVAQKERRENLAKFFGEEARLAAESPVKQASTKMRRSDVMRRNAENHVGESAWLATEAAQVQDLGFPSVDKTSRFDCALAARKSALKPWTPRTSPIKPEQLDQEMPRSVATRASAAMHSDDRGAHVTSSWWRRASALFVHGGPFVLLAWPLGNWLSICRGSNSCTCPSCSPAAT